ncbi:sacsin N-terminal ATP-binding-like domain-containing protein [Anabaena azotica]|uniref:Sacsin/Nov domain-containing protein n=1 Tax=Anabaena azotica FACHB-119 TaxID=947527 RepID=A0ABR8DA93_9NOST|nr:hypothetical protein [Anabaena azotica]MBD2504115.1 hypothetical protein [Anabaena azotica FACHB-119]
MAGYQIPPGTIVNNIKSLLKERYKQGFPIIKEIIQNANDGRATTLEFGINKGLRDKVEHPLLKIPALFFLNDGTFSQSDKEAICCFGIDANAKDKGKIGKFGLGQKSIFHFCEAFFYIASSQDVPEGCGEFISPWADKDGIDAKRPEWGELSDNDRHVVENYLIEQNLIQPQANYFVLWVPLRQKMADERCILANYYDDAKSVESNLPQDMKLRIGQLLPLLRHIRNVRYWLEDANGSLQQQFSVGLDNENPCQRCIYPTASQIIEEDEHDLQGKIIISTDTTGIRFAGKERILPANDFSLLLGQNPASVSATFWDDLQQSSYWTKRVSINESGNSESIPDKSIPHCAVVFTKQSLANKNKARLILQWSVFLPLASDDSTEGAEQEAYEVVDCQGEEDYTIFLHGYFFLDSGRKYIEGLQKIRTGGFEQKTPTNEDEMIAQWNYLLASKGTLKLFLPSLDNFVKIHRLSTLDISNLADAIMRSHFFKSKVYKQSICSDYQWVFRIKPTRSAWELIPVNVDVRSLPSIPPNWKVFPILSNFANSYYLIHQQQPNLLSNETSVNWSEQEIIDLLTSLDLQLLFAESKNVNYLISLLIQNRTIIGRSPIQTCLINLVREAFIVIGIDKLQQEQFHAAIKKIVELIHPEKRLKLKQLSSNIQHIQIVFNALYELDIKQPLLVYELFEANSSSSSGFLSNQQMVSILTCLSQLLTAGTTHQVAKAIIEQILEQTNSLEDILKLVSNLALFVGHNHQQNKAYIYSYLSLQQYKHKYCLFQGDRRDYETPIATAVKSALTECNLIFIEPKISRILGKTSALKAIPKLEPQTCLQLLATKPDLANSHERSNLLKELINHV